MALSPSTLIDAKEAKEIVGRDRNCPICFSYFREAALCRITVRGRVHRVTCTSTLTHAQINPHPTSPLLTFFSWDTYRFILKISRRAILTLVSSFLYDWGLWLYLCWQFAFGRLCNKGNFGWDYATSFQSYFLRWLLRFIRFKVIIKCLPSTTGAIVLTPTILQQKHFLWCEIRHILKGQALLIILSFMVKWSTHLNQQSFTTWNKYNFKFVKN